MATAERRAAALDRTWDAVIRGEPMPVSAAADAALVDLVVRLQATSAMPTLFPNPEAGWCELRAGKTGQPAIALQPSPLEGGNGRNDWTPPASAAPGRRQSARRWFLHQFATAALLLLTLGAGLLMLRQSAGRERDAKTWLPDTAIASIPGYAEDVLFEATFAAAELPAGPMEAVFYRTTVEAGASSPYVSATACFLSNCGKDPAATAVATELVASGTYALVLDAPVWVQRAGAPESRKAAPGTELVLSPGDVAIYHDATAAGEIRAVGPEPAVVVGAAIVDSSRDAGGRPDQPEGVTAIMLDATAASDWANLPAGPKTVTLRRVTLPARTLLPPFQPRGLESIRVERGSIAWTFAHSTEAAETGLRIHRRAGETAPFAITRNGAFRFLESTGDEPAELLVLTIEPAGLDGNPLVP